MAARIVLGIGSTTDYELEWDAETLSQLAEQYTVSLAELDTARPVVDERSLIVSILSFLAMGRGGERFVATTELIEIFTARFASRVTLGGTSPRAALALAALGHQSLVHLVSINDTVRELLPPEMSTLCSAERDSSEPHLIVQYPAGGKVRLVDGELTAPRANRLIYVNDEPNRLVRISSQLAAHVAEADVFLLSGFNTMRDEVLLQDRLDEVSSMMMAMRPGAISIFEDAGAHDRALGERVRDSICGVVDVYGMNEDELFDYVGSSFDLHDPDRAEAALRKITSLIPARCLVVHTAHWAVALSSDAERWRPAVQSAVEMAATRYLQGDEATAADVQRTRTLPIQPGGAAFAAELERRFGGASVCVPAYQVTTPTPTTIGLGDSFVGGFIAGWIGAAERTHV